MTVEELVALKSKIDRRLENELREMEPDYDDSITGFNSAWDIMRKVFEEEAIAK